MPCTSPAPTAQLITSQMQSCGRCRQRRGGVTGPRRWELGEQLARLRQEQTARQMPPHPVFIGTGYQYLLGPSRPSPGPDPSKGCLRAPGRGQGAGWVRGGSWPPFLAAQGLGELQLCIVPAAARGDRGALPASEVPACSDGTQSPEGSGKPPRLARRMRPAPLALRACAAAAPTERHPET